ncbi:MAG: M56 family metallopeptidase [Synechococcales cyanobacterium CRU_2_2]|nr:M56 family metallopeptidase [Synechococcales cyanobacterium CRU_2_2]
MDAAAIFGDDAIAVLKMGHHGLMLGQSVGWLGCHSVVGFGAIALGLLLLQAGQTWRTVAQIRQLPLQPVQGTASRQIQSMVPFAARVGFWQPDLVVSLALTQQLSPEELRAVLLHEQAHLQFRDTFWFFWLGWLRQCTRWLPQTEALWQELLLLREIRADRWAAQFADPLVIAEALLKMTQAAAVPLWSGAAFTEVDTETRLEARIRALLSPQSGFQVALGQAIASDPPPPEDSPVDTIPQSSFLPPRVDGRRLTG